MSIFSTILGKIFGRKEGSTSSGASAAAPSTGAPSSSTVIAGSNANKSSVDVEMVLSQLAQKNSQKLNWRTSIVDLLKLLDIDSSLKARQELAHELSYTGSLTDSAGMNIWLQKQVMQKLAANGGHVPAELRN